MGSGWMVEGRGGPGREVKNSFRAVGQESDCEL